MTFLVIIVSSLFALALIWILSKLLFKGGRELLGIIGITKPYVNKLSPGMEKADQLVNATSNWLGKLLQHIAVGGFVMFLIYSNMSKQDNKSSGIGVSEENSVEVRMVKDGTFSLCPQKTVGQIVNGFFEAPKWERVLADNARYVNVSGKILIYEKPVIAVLQLKLNDDNTFGYNALELNEVPQNNFLAMGLITKMCNEPSSQRGTSSVRKRN